MNAGSSSEKLSEDELAKLMQSLQIIKPISHDESVFLLKRLQERLTISMDEGAAIRDNDFRPWLAGRKNEIGWFFWERYYTFLIGEAKWPTLVANTLDRNSDKMLELLGNPAQEGNWARKGLIFGDVQSGKTATYTALINKAADAGFKLIILLTGTIESLRRQTQIRLDEGFIGRDSLEALKGKKGGVDSTGQCNSSLSIAAGVAYDKVFRGR